jgi:hypothetical protein
VQLEAKAEAINGLAENDDPSVGGSFRKYGTSVLSSMSQFRWMASRTGPTRVSGVR